jgi:hypothetical protein
VSKTVIPLHGDRDGPAVDQFDDKLISRYADHLREDFSTSQPAFLKGRMALLGRFTAKS